MVEPRFLVLRLGSLGDIVHSFPAVAALRETFPAADIVWLTHPRWAALVKSAALASELRQVETRSTASLRQAILGVRQSQWTAAIDYQGLWKSAALPFLGGVRRRIGFSAHTIREFGVPLLYTERVKAATIHIAEQNGELSVRAGARKVAAPFSLRVPAEAEAEVRAQLQRCRIDRYIVLSPGGGWRAKCWPADRFGALCREIWQCMGLHCVVNFGPGEEDLAHAVRAASAGADPLLYDGELGQLMALLRNAMCIVGGDTGPLHLAIALGTPAVALYGPTDPVRNGPYHYAPGSLVGRSSSDGRTAPYFGDDIVLRDANAATSHTRNDQADPSMLAIDVASVFAALRRRIGAAA
jgi:lipopolysaccharide heptosyltransferase I